MLGTPLLAGQCWWERSSRKTNQFRNPIESVHSINASPVRLWLLLLLEFGVREWGSWAFSADVTSYWDVRWGMMGSRDQY